MPPAKKKTPRRAAPRRAASGRAAPKGRAAPRGAAPRRRAYALSGPVVQSVASPSLRVRDPAPHPLPGFPQPPPPAPQVPGRRPTARANGAAVNGKAINGRAVKAAADPRRVFEATGCRLFHGDALALLEEVPDETFDLIFADPPYGLSNGGMSVHAGRRVRVDKGDWDKSRGAGRDAEFHRAWIAACRRVLKPDGSLWVSGTHHSIYACGFALQQGGWHILNEIAWFKPNGPPHLACRMFAHSHETLIWARRTKGARHHFEYERMRREADDSDFYKKPGKQMRSVWAINTPGPEEKRHGKHPTQKPLRLLERIVLACSRPGDLVLDPFCGSATTGVAALAHGRRFVGIDSERRYLDDHAVPRLQDALRLRGGRR